MSDHVQVTDDDLWDIREVCKFFGGTKPLHPATIYRHVKTGLISPPDHIGGSSRWRGSKCRADKLAMIGCTDSSAA
jgi:predicted DNA-binding transcriptional regulator AlpA